MSKVENNYGANYYASVSQKQKSASEVENKKAKEAEAAKTGSTKQPKLSKAAQKMLEKLKKKYSNMDFMVADFDNVSEAKEILSRGTKEYSVLFSSEELEKMASSEKSEKEYMDKIDGAVRMSNQINAKYGFQSADGKDAEITKIGVSFNKDGTATYFAELEKSSENQRERIDKAREKRAQERKAEKDERYYDKEKTGGKRTTVIASSEKELLQKINAVDWSKIKEEQDTEGGKFDYSV